MAKKRCGRKLCIRRKVDGKVVWLKKDLEEVSY